jgi:hypothetical protein
MEMILLTYFILLAISPLIGQILAQSFGLLNTEPVRVTPTRVVRSTERVFNGLSFLRAVPTCTEGFVDVIYG